jgi:hypothetical protein
MRNSYDDGAGIIPTILVILPAYHIDCSLQLDCQALQALFNLAIENSQNMNCIASVCPLTWMHDRQSSYDEIQLNTREHFHNFRHLRMAFHPVHC